jgi:dihydroorotate dehydrogenase
MDLATTYLGLSLRNPLVASASPLSQSADRVIELVEAGVSAVVLHSLSRSRSSTRHQTRTCRISSRTRLGLVHLGATSN